MENPISRDLVATQINHLAWQPGNMEERYKKRLSAWHNEGLASKIWEKPTDLWPASTGDIKGQLGWLFFPEQSAQSVSAWEKFAAAIQGEGFRQVVLLGMGGASLPAAVFYEIFGHASGYPELIVLDTCHPRFIRDLSDKLDLQHTLFVVTSKSGVTIETLALFRYFWDRLRAARLQPSRHFVAITSQGTPLELIADARNFRAVFLASADISGRYSALNGVGLLPAALLGIDIELIIKQASWMAAACRQAIPEEENPAFTLGAALGELALAGRDKLTFVTCPRLRTFAQWLELLCAETTGKNGKGIIPIVGEPLGWAECYKNDRVFVGIYLEEDDNSELEKQLSVFETAGHPVFRIYLQHKANMAQEIFRWELATLAMSYVLGVHPLAHPGNDSGKKLLSKALEQGAKLSKNGGISQANVAQIPALTKALNSWQGQIEPGDYVALQAYLSPSPEIDAALEKIRIALRNHLRVATTICYGPRFLHTTAQLHKNGPNTGHFLQILDENTDTEFIPEEKFSFNSLLAAQAIADYQALKQCGRHVLRIELGQDVLVGLARLIEILRI